MICKLYYNKNVDDGDLASAHAPIAFIFFYYSTKLYQYTIEQNLHR
jgi:hypothetical protein